MKKIAYILVLMEALATLALGWFPFNRSLSIGIFAFYLWTISPYFLMAWLIKSGDRKTAIAGAFGVCFVVGLFGLAIIFGATVVNPDPQSGIAYALTPLLQWIVLSIFALFYLTVIKRRRIQSEVARPASVK